MSDTLSLKEMLKYRKEELFLTKDVRDLNKKSSHLLFVYGTEKRFFRGHNNLLANAEFLFEGWTEGANYTLYNYQDKYPVMFDKTVEQYQVKASRIRGEVYLVTGGQLADAEWWNNECFSRQKTSVMTINPTPTKGSDNNKIVVLQGVNVFVGRWPDWRVEAKNEQLVPSTLYERNDKTFDYYFWSKLEDTRGSKAA